MTSLLHVTDHLLDAAGSGRYLQGLIDGFRERGIRQGVVTGSLSPDLQIEQYAFPTRNDGNFLPALLRRLAPDAVLVHKVAHLPGLEPLRRHPGKKVVVVTDHAWDCPSGLRYFRRSGQPCQIPPGPACLAHYYLSGCHARLDPREFLRAWKRLPLIRLWHRDPNVSWMVISSYLKELFLAAGLVPAERILVNPCFPLVPGEFPPPAWERTILYSGRLTRAKGIQVLLEALSRLPPVVRLWVDGSGPWEAPLRRLARRLGVEGRTDFLGWLPPEEHWERFRTCTVLAVPSVWGEPFGMVGIEAARAGKPVVAARAGGIPEWLDDGRTGYLVPPGDATALAEKLAILLQDRERAQRMGEAGRLLVTARFDRRRHLEQLLFFCQPGN